MRWYSCTSTICTANSLATVSYTHLGLTSIGRYAFRNKKIAEVKLPETVEALPKNVFAKEVTSASGKTEAYSLVTKVYVDDVAKYTDCLLYTS